jgi:CheY-like chemotaxis protein
MNLLLENNSTMFGQTKKEISIHKNFQADLWAVEVDPNQFDQLLLNLYLNACEAMPGGGNLYLETANIITTTKIDLKTYQIRPGRYVKINVTDVGIGMDEQTRERIFEPFFTTREMGRGTGLGLAMVYGIIKGHNGYINVYSEKGKGTTFSIYLPASDKEITKQENDKITIVRGNETILIVDDEETVLQVMKEMSEALGYQVMFAGSGPEAIKIFEENRDRIALVILDIIMPNMGGGETFDHLRRINPKVNVILSSGYSINSEATKIMDRGCKEFIQKPISLNELSTKIRKALSM